MLYCADCALLWLTVLCSVLKIQVLEEQIKSSAQQKEQDAVQLQQITALYTAEAASRSVTEEELKSWKDWILDDEKTGMNQQAITQLQQELAKLRTEHSSALNAVSTANAETEMLKQQLAEAMTEKQQAASEVELQLAELKKQVSDKEAKMMTLSKQAASSLADLNKSRSHVANEEQTHATQMLKATSEHQATLQALHAAQQHAVQLETTSGACEKCTHLQQQIAELQAKQNQPNSSEQSPNNSAQNEQVTEACQLLQQYKVLIASKDKQLAEAQSHATNLSDEFKSKSRASHTEIRSLQQRCNEMQDELNRHGNLQTQLDEAQSLLLKKEKVASDALHQQELLKIKLRQTEDSVYAAQQTLVLNSSLRSMSSGGGSMMQVDQNPQSGTEFAHPAATSRPESAPDSIDDVAKPESDFVNQDQSASNPDADGGVEQVHNFEYNHEILAADLTAADHLATGIQTVQGIEQAVNSDISLQATDGNIDEEMDGLETAEESENYVANGDNLADESVVADPMDLADDVHTQDQNVDQAENGNDGENTAAEDFALQHDEVQPADMQIDIADEITQTGTEFEPMASEYEVNQITADEMDAETDGPATEDPVDAEKMGQDDVRNMCGLTEDSAQNASVELLAGDAAPEQLGNLDAVVDCEPEAEGVMDIAKDTDQVQTVGMQDGDEDEQSVLEEEGENDIVIDNELAEEQDHDGAAASEDAEGNENAEDSQDDLGGALEDNNEAIPSDALTEDEEEDVDDAHEDDENDDIDDDHDADGAMQVHDEDDQDGLIEDLEENQVDGNITDSTQGKEDTDQHALEDGCDNRDRDCGGTEAEEDVPVADDHAIEDDEQGDATEEDAGNANNDVDDAATTGVSNIQDPQLIKEEDCEYDY